MSVHVGSEAVVALLVFFFVLVSFAFFLYVFFDCRRSSPPPLPPPPPTSILVLHVATPAGLDPAVVRALPVVVFRRVDIEEGLECTVCLSELVDGEKTRVLPRCNHRFHVECVDRWFRAHSTCPVCRRKVEVLTGESNVVGGEKRIGGGCCGRGDVQLGGPQHQHHYTTN